MSDEQDSEFVAGMICGFVSVGIASMLTGDYGPAGSAFLAAALWALWMMGKSLLSRASK